MRQQQVLGLVDNAMGTYLCVDQAPQTGESQYTLTAILNGAELHNTSNHLCLAIEELTAAGSWRQVISLGWQGGPAQGAPSITYTFPATGPNNNRVVALPRRLRGIQVNGTADHGSEVSVQSMRGIFS